MAKEEKQNCVLPNDGNGEVKLSDDVIAVIAGMSATEVEGVHSMAGNITNEVVSKFGVKNLSKGIKVDISGQEVTVYLSLVLKTGYNVKAVSTKVQDRVKSMIENMTGLKVKVVHVRIADVKVCRENY